jgi:hypothetical protein
VAEPSERPGEDRIEVVPVVVLSQVFTARPSSIPDIRDFVRRCLAESPLTEQGIREVGETVFRALLDAAGPAGSIQVAFRIFPEHVEVDVLRSDSAIPSPLTPGPPVSSTALGRPAAGQLPGQQYAAAGRPAPAAGAPPGRAAVPPGSESARPSGAQPRTGGEPAPPAPGSAALPAPEPAVPAPDPATAQEAPAAGDQAGLSASFAEWMASALRREGLTQEAAARQLGVSVKTVSRWVGGATEPRMRDLRRIREIFGDVPFP